MGYIYIYMCRGHSLANQYCFFAFKLGLSFQSVDKLAITTCHARKNSFYLRYAFTEIAMGDGNWWTLGRFCSFALSGSFQRNTAASYLKFSPIYGPEWIITYKRLSIGWNYSEYLIFTWSSVHRNIVTGCGSCLYEEYVTRICLFEATSSTHF